MTALGITGGSTTRSSLARLGILPNRRQPNVLAPTGDSRVDAVFVDLLKITYGARSPLNVAKALMEQRFTIGPAFGVSGERTDQILARMLNGTGDPRKTNAGIMYIQAGVNDITWPTAFTDVVSGVVVTTANVAENTAANLKRMAQLGVEAGMIVVIENEVGANGVNTAERAAILMDLRQSIAEYGESTPGVYVHDAFSIVTSPTASATAITLRPTLIYDGLTHFNALGCFLWGKSLSALLNSIVPAASRGSLPIQNVAESSGRRQLLPNPLFVTATRGTAGSGISSGTLTANTTSGSSSLVVTAGRTVPSGTQITGPGIPANTFVNTTGTSGTYAMVNAAGSAVNATATATGASIVSAIVPSGCVANTMGSATGLIDTVASANGLGNDVTFAATFAANGDAVRLRQDLNGSSANGGTYNAALRPGDILQAVAQIEITAPPVNLASLYLSLTQNSGSGSDSMTAFDLYAASAPADYGINEACRLTLATRPFVLAAPTGAFPYVSAEVRAVARAAGSCNFTIRQLGLRRRNAAY